MPGRGHVSQFHRKSASERPASALTQRLTVAGQAQVELSLGGGSPLLRHGGIIQQPLRQLTRDRGADPVVPTIALGYELRYRAAQIP